MVGSGIGCDLWRRSPRSPWAPRDDGSGAGHRSHGCQDGVREDDAEGAEEEGAIKKKKTRKSNARKTVRAAPPVLSYGQKQGLRATPDPLSLKSSVALVVDQDSGEVIFSKNPRAVLPIASITKLMTALVITEAELPLRRGLTVTQDDIDVVKGTHRDCVSAPASRAAR